jgi:hypothetical protein
MSALFLFLQSFATAQALDLAASSRTMRFCSFDELLLLVGLGGLEHRELVFESSRAVSAMSAFLQAASCPHGLERFKLPRRPWCRRLFRRLRRRLAFLDRLDAFSRFALGSLATFGAAFAETFPSRTSSPRPTSSARFACTMVRSPRLPRRHFGARHHALHRCTPPFGRHSWHDTTARRAGSRSGAAGAGSSK